MSTGRRTRPLPTPWFAITLMLGGAALLLASWLWSLPEIPAALEHRLEAAGATVVPAAATWLRAGNLTARLLTGGAGLLALGAVVLVLRRRLFRTARPVAEADGVTGRAALRRSAWVVPVLGALAVFARYYPTLRSGYFRYDDFEFVAAAADGGWTTLFQLHGDHFMPLTRLLFGGAVSLFGVTALPYNVGVLLAFATVVAVGCRVLHELEVSRAAQLLFASLLIGWSTWAEMLAGYYVLSIYLLIAALGEVAIWRYLCWRRTGAPGDARLAALCCGIAPLFDLSGWYVAGACGLFFACDLVSARVDPTTSPKRRHRPMVVALAIAVTFSLGVTWWGYAVMHPGSFLGMAHAGPRSVLQIAGDLGYLFSAGILASMAVPFVYARLPGPMLTGIVVVMLVAWLVFLVGSLRGADRSRRTALLAILGIVFATGLMVVLGRPPEGAGVVRWAAKHLCPVYVWFCLGLAAGWDVFWRNADLTRRMRLIEITLALGFVFLCAQYAGGLVGLLVEFPPFGYPAELRDARLRRNAVARLYDEVVVPFTANAPAPRVLPTLDGRRIQAQHPSLFTYNLSHYLPFFGGAADQIRLVRNAAMQPWHTPAVQTVASLRAAVPLSTRRLLADHPGLRGFYFGPGELAGRPLSPPSAGSVMPFTAGQAVVLGQPDGSMVVRVGARTELTLLREPWDPEQRQRLRIVVEGPVGSISPLKIGLEFSSDLLDARWSGTLQVPSSGIEVDLLQLYAFSLSERVRELRLILTTPGEYRFARLEFVP